MTPSSSPPPAPDRGRAIRAIKILLFSASIIPSIVGGAIAEAAGSFAWTPFLLAAAGLFIGQAGGDYLYYYLTHFHTDARDAHTKIFAGWRPLFAGALFAPERTVWAGVACLLIDLAIAVYFFQVRGAAILWFALAGGLIAVFFTPLMLRGLKEPVIYLMAIGAFLVFFYTSPPLMLNYRGLGETALFFAFRPLITGGVYYVLRPQFLWEPILLGAFLGIFTMNIGIVSNTFDHNDDAQSGKRTLALRLGQANAVRFLTVVSVAAYVVLVAAVFAGLATPWSLLALLAAPLAVQTVRKTWLFADAANYTAAMTKAITLSSVSGILLCVGYGIAICLQ